MCLACESDYKCVLACVCVWYHGCVWLFVSRLCSFSAGSLRGGSALMCGCSDADVLVLSRQSSAFVNTHKYTDTHTHNLCFTSP